MKYKVRDTASGLILLDQANFAQRGFVIVYLLIFAGIQEEV